ncbi:hypothetical protein GCM10010489_38240 [Microbacterium saperdae]|nr:hypothetical protein GCM10010489_38240 [Microbacterium saperdae]
MLLGVVYLLIAATCTGLIEQGWSKWLHPMFFLALWNGLKFLFFGPWSLVLLVRARVREMRVHGSAGHTKPV